MTPIRSPRLFLVLVFCLWFGCISLLSLGIWRCIGNPLQAQDDYDDGGGSFFFEGGDDSGDMETMDDGNYDDGNQDDYDANEEELTPLQERLLDRQEERLDRLWERGAIDDNEYEDRLDRFAETIGANLEQNQDVGGYDPGWQERYTDWQQYQQNSNLNVDQKKLYIDYVRQIVRAHV